MGVVSITAVGDKEALRQRASAVHEILRISSRKRGNKDGLLTSCFMVGNRRGKPTSNDKYISFIVDSGASEHMVNNKEVSDVQRFDSKRY